ncbi:helix-turn-helix domain-containing protein [Frankia sp. Mgl5]|uniref:helix-turn-helix domain-containing protein n=1 Tax=Frankia sp. Mgl5 TaxID=2933793 RepID=UPI0020100BD4|nr:helix-turn-helix transcriptional regulator [Frankia sp. Mgl5]MCK9928102.1 helix-turn-helix domain-containing protein [Frankia sp. Mgl5]
MDDADQLEQMQRQMRAGAWLRSARTEAGYRSAAAFAKVVGVHQTQINNYERGVHRIPEERAPDLAAALRIPVVELRRRLGMWLPDDLPSGQTVSPEEAIRADETLTADQRELLLSMLATLRSQQPARVGASALQSGVDLRRRSGSAPTVPDFSDDFDDADLDNFSSDHDPDRPPRDDWE